MGEPCIISWTRLIASNVVCQEACLFYGIILTETGSSEKYVVVYDGQATGGNYFHRYYCPGKDTKEFNLPKPVKFERGLYVDMAGGVDQAVVLWQPL